MERLLVTPLNSPPLVAVAVNVPARTGTNVVGEQQILTDIVVPSVVTTVLQMGRPPRQVLSPPTLPLAGLLKSLSLLIPVRLHREDREFPVNTNLTCLVATVQSCRRGRTIIHLWQTNLLPPQTP